MGTLTLPTTGTVYIDTMVLIYTVERYPTYWSLLEPLWQHSKAGAIEIVTSELTLMEVLVVPLKMGNVALAQALERALVGTELRLLPITQPILRQAAHLRARHGLKAADALHAAAAVRYGCALFVTNDAGFRAVADLPVVVLDECLAS